MRTFDRSDLWFAIILAALFILAAAAFGPVFVGTATIPDFWATAVPIVAMSLARPFLGRLAGAPRFVGWFCLGLAATVPWTIFRAEPFNLILAAGIGVMLAVIDLVTEYFRARKERRRRNEHA